MKPYRTSKGLLSSEWTFKNRHENQRKWRNYGFHRCEAKFCFSWAVWARKASVTTVEWDQTRNNTKNELTLRPHSKSETSNFKRKAPNISFRFQWVNMAEPPDQGGGAVPSKQNENGVLEVSKSCFGRAFRFLSVPGRFSAQSAQQKRKWKNFWYTSMKSVTSTFHVGS